MKLRWILAVQAAIFLFGFLRTGPVGNPIPEKLLISGLFVATALLLYLKARNSRYAAYMAGAMVFCFGGDIATSELVAGGMMTAMLFFGAAHVLFITGYYQTARQRSPTPFRNRFVPGAVVYGLAFFLVWGLTVAPAEVGAAFRLGSLFYGLLVSIMAAAAIPLAAADRVYLPAAVGAGLFWISDSLIAVGLTRPFPGIALAVLSTYFLGLAGILYAGKKTAR